MPYIKPERRNAINSGTIMPHTAGDLNYIVTRFINHYLGYVGISYEEINRVIGVLECAKLELYRRIAAPYEDIKLEENGDVYQSNQTAE